jgi:acetyl esterase/lipase
MKKLSTVFFYVATIIASFSQTLTPTFSGIDYVGKGAVRQDLDIYIPSGLTKPAPIIVFIHGGGWATGGKGAGNVPYFESSFKSGFIIADINYRVSSDSVWPAQIEDCKTAVRFLKANAAKYNIDTCRFGVIGGSAGGHLCAMMGTSAGVKALEGAHQGYNNVSSRVQAVVDMYGPTDFSLMDGHYTGCSSGALKHNHNSFETNLLGVDTLTKNPAAVQSANPIAYITKDDAKFFIIHGGADCSVPTYQSVILDSVLRVKGVPADTFIIAANQGHGGTYFQSPNQTALYLKFFQKHLSTPCATRTGTNDVFVEGTPSVFPNPATSEITISVKDNVSFSTEIMNTLGAVVLKSQNQTTVDVSRLQHGIYFLRMKVGSDFYINKFVKQ